jgi:hypothetical protein
MVVGSVIFCTVHVLSQGSGQLVFPKNFLFFLLTLSISYPVSLILFTIHMNSSLFGIVMSWNLLFLQNHFSHRLSYIVPMCISHVAFQHRKWLTEWFLSYSWSTITRYCNIRLVRYEWISPWCITLFTVVLSKSVTVLAMFSFMGQS